MPAHRSCACLCGAARAGIAGAPASALRSHAFNAIFLGYTFLFVLSAYPLLLLPSRRPIARAIKAYAKGVLWLTRRVAGVRVETRGRGNLPQGACILASKHQSEADGIIQMALVDDLAFVAMKEVGKYPLVGPVLSKLAMVPIDTDGGARGRYRAGVYHLAAELGLPVIPVATDVGRCWDRRHKAKRPGTVAVSFLPALSAGVDKRAFMAALEEAIEAESARLAAENGIR